MSILIDISIPLSGETLVYPGDPRFEPARISDAGKGDDYTMTKLSMSVHCGTHIDAPSHFISGGTRISDYPLDRFILDALVVECNGDTVEPHHIPVDQRETGQAILFKTRNSVHLRAGRIPEQPCFISPAAASALVEAGAGLVGIDWLSVEPGTGGEYPVHLTLLSRDILIMETIALDGVAPGRYTLSAFPLALADAEASPVRAVLIPR